MVYSEEIEAQSNCEKSYLWWFRNLACGDLTGSNQIKKDQFGVPPGLAWTKGRGRLVWFSVCEAPLDDWGNDGSGGVFFTYGEYGFSSVKMCCSPGVTQENEDTGWVQDAVEVQDSLV